VRGWTGRIFGGPATQRWAVTTASAPAASPIVVTASSGRPDAPAALNNSSAAGPAAQLRLPSDGAQIVTVDSTDGEGVWVRRQPAGEPMRVWSDGSPMLIVGEDQFADGRAWRNVSTLDGQTGWVAADFVTVADPAIVAAGIAGLDELMRGGGGLATSGHLQARVAVGADTTPTPAQPAAPPGQPTSAPSATAKPQQVAFIGQSTVPQTATATSAATATPQPTATTAPTATPIKATAGATSIDVGQTKMAVASVERGIAGKIGNRPRSGMELLAVKVRVTNRGDSPFALYRGAFRLALSDRTRVEPLAGGPSPLPYSAEVPPGGVLEGSLTFEVPTGTRVDALIWAPDRDAAYSLTLQN
jgi:hypothetical protein